MANTKAANFQDSTVGTGSGAGVGGGAGPVGGVGGVGLVGGMTGLPGGTVIPGIGAMDEKRRTRAESMGKSHDLRR
jgi:hypothetical protein